MCVIIKKLFKKCLENDDDKGVATNECVRQVNLTAKAYSDIADWCYLDQFHKASICRVSVLW